MSKNNANPVEAMGAQAAAMTDMFKTMSALNVPMDSLAKLQSDYVAQATALWNDSLANAASTATASASGGAKAGKPLSDKRFASQAWAQNPMAAMAAQTYLLNARTMMQLAEAVQGDAKTKARIRFAVQQVVDAASPANFLALNPDAIAKAKGSPARASAKASSTSDMACARVVPTFRSTAATARPPSVFRLFISSRPTLRARRALRLAVAVLGSSSAKSAPFKRPNRPPVLWSAASRADSLRPRSCKNWLTAA